MLTRHTRVGGKCIKFPDVLNGHVGRQHSVSSLCWATELRGVGWLAVGSKCHPTAWPSCDQRQYCHQNITSTLEAASL